MVNILFFVVCTPASYRSAKTPKINGHNPKHEAHSVNLTELEALSWPAPCPSPSDGQHSPRAAAGAEMTQG